MLQNAYFLAKIGADTAENEQHFAEILPIGHRVADPSPFVTPSGAFWLRFPLSTVELTLGGCAVGHQLPVVFHDN